MRNYKIYTDGSDLKHTTHRMGIGGILLDSQGKILDRISRELSHDWLRENYGTSDCSNPTAEMVAAKEALETWSREYFEYGDQIDLYADYMGVREWNTGVWKINKPYIRKIYEEIKEIIKNTGIKVTWNWVKGHQGGQSVYGTDKYWNDKVDLLAKGKEDI